jgi:hypothetical protein
MECLPLGLKLWVVGEWGKTWRCVEDGGPVFVVVWRWFLWVESDLGLMGLVGYVRLLTVALSC